MTDPELNTLDGAELLREVARLTAERNRLRVALEQIINANLPAMDTSDLKRIARRALEDK